MPVRLAAAVVVISAVAVACSDDPVDSGDGAAIPPQLDGFDLEVVDVDDRPWFVAVADTQQQRRTGLMNVSDLGDLDGVLFVFGSDSTEPFWMKDTLIPLDVAFFAADGVLVSVTRMSPCEEDACEWYYAEGAYRYALEAEAGDLTGLPTDARLDFAP